MRVLVVVVIGALITSTCSEVVAKENLSGPEFEMNEPLPPEAQTFLPFWKKKKKKVKTSSRLKKKNRRMGKKFRRQNDDTLRR